MHLHLHLHHQCYHHHHHFQLVLQRLDWSSLRVSSKPLDFDFWFFDKCSMKTKNLCLPQCATIMLSSYHQSTCLQLLFWFVSDLPWVVLVLVSFVAVSAHRKPAAQDVPASQKQEPVGEAGTPWKRDVAQSWWLWKRLARIVTILGLYLGWLWFCNRLCLNARRSHRVPYSR
jgi:hypothetical protein